MVNLYLSKMKDTTLNNYENVCNHAIKQISIKTLYKIPSMCVKTFKHEGRFILINSFAEICKTNIL